VTVDLRTCSYAEYRPEMGVPLRISLGRPKWWTTPIPESAFVPEITPKGWYLRSPERAYLAAYDAQLARYGPELIQARFDTIAAEHGEPLVLLCFENLASGAWCHRSLFSAYWRQQTGQEIPELGETYTVSNPNLPVI